MNQRRRILFWMGKYLQRVGELLKAPGERLEWFSRSLWEANCDCYKCQERRESK